MIFITLGSQKFQFDRLLKAVDQLIAEGGLQDKVFAQIGYSDYKPQHFEYQEFLDREAFAQKMGEADIVITHGGTGAIIGAVNKGKKVIAIPRLARYGEHVDDHQIQIIEQFRDMGILCPCMTCDDLPQALETVRVTTYRSYQSNTQNIINSIDAFLRG